MSDSVLSPAEWAVFQDKSFMPLKAAVCQQVESILADVHQDLKSVPFPEKIEEAIRQSTPKLSKGENHHTYAYRVLDYPRVFAGEDMFLFRVMMLWGHHLSVHLIVRGTYQAQYLPAFKQAREALDDSWQVSLDPNPWTWIPTMAKEIPLQQTDDILWDQTLSRHPFVKLSRYLPLQSLAELPALSKAYWAQWLSLLG